MRLSLARLAPICALALLSSACDDGISPATGQLTLSFVAASGDAAAASPALEPGATSLGMVDATGTNGILTIDEIQIVVDEFKLERVEGACEVPAEEEEEELEDCPIFETPPYFLDLPLDAVPVDIATSPVDDGSYTFLKLETKDLASSAGDDTGEMESLGEQVLAAYPEWPESASLRVAGSFDPDDGSDPRPFVVYLHAEVKVELGFDPPLAVSADDELVAVVEVDPVAWFTNEDGTVVDLSEFDFETTEGEVVDFEAKMADGFTKVELAG